MSRVALKALGRWIAGETASDALRQARKANLSGLKAIVNFLGESATDRNEVLTATREYTNLTDAIARRRLEACISVKPTQLGLYHDARLAASNLTKLAEVAARVGCFLWMDMESSTYTDSTLTLYTTLRARFSNVGVALQANLKRSRADLNILLNAGGVVRLVKGAYREHPRIALTRREDVKLNFRRLMKALFESQQPFALGTHDQSLIQEAAKMTAAQRGDVEFQMLMGITDNLKLDLARKGFRVAEYIPYGRKWLPYSLRRLRERKENILLIVQSLFTR